MKECVDNLNQEDEEEKLVSSLWGAERCLRVLESVSMGQTRELWENLKNKPDRAASKSRFLSPGSSHTLYFQLWINKQTTHTPADLESNHL